MRPTRPPDLDVRIESFDPDEAGIGHGSQVHEGHTTSEQVRGPPGGLHGQSGLADAAGTGEGQQPPGRVGEAGEEVVQLLHAPDQGGGRGRETGVARPGERLVRRPGGRRLDEMRPLLG